MPTCLQAGGCVPANDGQQDILMTRYRCSCMQQDDSGCESWSSNNTCSNPGHIFPKAGLAL